MENMTLREFAEHLALHIEYNPAAGDMKLYLATDGEGNEFRPYSGDFEIMHLDEVLEYPKYPSEDKVVVFYPNW